MTNRKIRTVTVLGAGITGVTTAYKLSQRGFDVTLIDRNRYAAMETSFANGGQLSASNAEVWTQIPTVFKGLRWMLKSDAPLLMNPSPSWHKISWMLEFLASIPNAKRNTIETARMAIRAREHLLEMAAEGKVDFDFRPCGILHFYKSQADLEHARHINSWLAEAGLKRQELSPAETRQKEPALRGDVIGGFWTESDATGDIHKFTTGLMKAAQKNGARFLGGLEVRKLSAGPKEVRIDTDQGSTASDAVVICAGIGSRDLAKQVGDRVNIYPVKGYSVTVQLDHGSQNAAPNTSLLDDKAKIVTSRLGKDRFRIAGTAEFNGPNLDIRANRIAPLVKWCRQHFPNVSTEHVVPWAGLRPMMPSMMPKIGKGHAPGVFYNTGHGHLGWTLSGITAEMVSAEIEGASSRPKVLTPSSRLARL